MNEINDLSNTDMETREITDLTNSEYENYSVTDLINIPLIVGPQGPPNVLSVGEVKTGDKSNVKIRGNSPNQILDFTLEKGDKGETGESGVYIGDTEPVDEAIKVWIQPDGQGSNILKIRNSKGQFEGVLSIKGDQGKPGQDGSPGPANTLTIGTVQSGDTASATITGQAPNQVLNLVLVKGDTGQQGQQGPPGTPAKNYIIETTNRTVETEIEQNTNYEVPTYEVGTNSLSIYFEGSKLIKNVNYIEVDSTHIQFKDWDVPVDSNLEIIIRKEEK
jgi:hypothetical protein|uniref:PROTEIN (MANNOSE-BINDING PROTEIN A), HOST DEFENSE, METALLOPROTEIN, SUGAR.9A n=1 Tax=Myoviridae sp. cthRr4 TaxID=2825152 RepID=A0A8S5NUR0_9CAUD|nr:MAG TPA: PROTEIN (MANNOSE-BINDING PROTEIN A), HOST DEFENSE, METALLOPROTEIN, SUGAR.9A [Myoviridae sp. cthRr4]